MHRVPPKGCNPSLTVPAGPFPQAAVPDTKPVPGVGSSSRAMVSARILLQHGLSRGCRWIPAPSMGLHGLQELSCLTMVFSRAASDSALVLEHLLLFFHCFRVWRVNSHYIFISLLSHNCCTFLNYLISEVSQLHWWAQLWPRMGLFWSKLCLAVPAQGQTLASSHPGHLCSPRHQNLAM